jgi:hypothetical protein
MQLFDIVAVQRGTLARGSQEVDVIDCQRERLTCCIPSPARQTVAFRA